MPTPSISVIDWNHQPLTLTAKVDAVLNPTDSLLWEHEFVAELTPDPYGNSYEVEWDGVNSNCNYGYQNLASGLWRFTVLSGAVDAGDHRIEITDYNTGELLITLTALNEPVELILPGDSDRFIDLLQPAIPAIATVEFTRIAYWNTSGYEPTFNSAGNQLTAHWPYTPRAGIITARAKVYDANNFTVATSGDLTLTITGASSGGC